MCAGRGLSLIPLALDWAEVGSKAGAQNVKHRRLQYIYYFLPVEKNNIEEAKKYTRYKLFGASGKNREFW